MGNRQAEIRTLICCLTCLLRDEQPGLGKLQIEVSDMVRSGDGHHQDLET